ISEEDVPQYMDEFDQLEDLFFGKVKEDNKLKEARLKGLYYYSNLSKPPAAPSQHIPYRLLVELAKVAPPDNPVEYIEKRLQDYRAIKQVDEAVERKISYALNWAKEFPSEELSMEIGAKEK